MYSVVIATYNRKKQLQVVIDCLIKQSFKPENIIIIDSSEQSQLYISKEINIKYKHVSYKSAAKQRNEGILLCVSKYVVFLDDDVEFDRSFFKQIFDLVLKEDILVCGPRQVGAEIKQPSKLLWAYYRLQAGYSDVDYGGQLFGAGLNCYPCYKNTMHKQMIKVQWLPSTCLIIKKEILDQYKFPNFEGYSYAEDVYLTASIGKSYPLYCFPNISYLHHSVSTPFKQNTLALNKMKLQNQKKIAKEIIGLQGFELHLKFFFHKLFISLAALKNQNNKLLYLRSIWQ